MQAIHYFSADEVRAMPDDGNRYETVYGELLVSPSPPKCHQGVLGELYLILGNYLKREGLSGLYFSPADISWGPDILVQPDLFVATRASAAADSWVGVKHLLLVVEVLSPSSIKADRFTKRRLYQNQGIPLYWIVDIENQLVEVWTPEAKFPNIEKEQLAWQHPEATTACVVALAELFREALPPSPQSTV